MNICNKTVVECFTKFTLTVDTHSQQTARHAFTNERSSDRDAYQPPHLTIIISELLEGTTYAAREMARMNIANAGPFAQPS